MPAEPMRALPSLHLLHLLLLPAAVEGAKHNQPMELNLIVHFKALSGQQLLRYRHRRARDVVCPVQKDRRCKKEKRYRQLGWKQGWKFK
ncbi:uncharacterized protein B0T23DRAFT_137433 [Neurospora hispaniola]|uniref:Uncharacterized protein n=1 Tax=Neurospora hispaniola TaxID=588809 RepID=A0AAJ0I788_9PEZI|nr:hypothetical protein B0T23DRAFT_137433 [Neurospora hispaniola]